MARLFAACVHNHGPNHSSVMADPNIPYSPLAATQKRTFCFMFYFTIKITICVAFWPLTLLFKHFLLFYGPFKPDKKFKNLHIIREWL